MFNLKKMMVVRLFAALAFLGVSYAAFADQPNYTGTVLRFVADPSDVGASLQNSAGTTVNNGCGGVWFILHRSNENFKEMEAVLMAAKLSQTPVYLYIASCSGDRAIISHGSF